MTELLHQVGAVCYAAAGGLGWRALRSGRGKGGSAWLLGTGALVHASGFVVLHREVPPIPMESFPAALSLIGWLIAVSYLLSLRFARIQGVGTWVALAAAVFTSLAWLGLIARSDAALDVAGSGAWSHAHVLLSTCGFSLLALASVAGLAYLVKERALKHKSAARLGLPSLESLDRMGHFTLATGFALLTLGVVTGFVWGIDRALDPWTAHTYWLLGAWLVYLLPVGSRIVRHEHGDRPARFAAVGFLVLAFAYIGIRLIGDMA